MTLALSMTILSPYQLSQNSTQLQVPPPQQRQEQQPSPTKSVHPSPKSMNIPSLPHEATQPRLQLPPPPLPQQLSPAAPAAVVGAAAGPSRRESFQFTGERPRPPPLRTAYSAIGPMSSSSPLMFRTGTDPDRDVGGGWETPQSARDEKQQLDKEELTTKGRKRKRLAKACSACHKNKRRCDGFAPCSNCEFSNRPCLYVNAQGDPIPPPRTRDSSATPAGKGNDKDINAIETTPGGHDRKPSGESNWSRKDSFREANGEAAKPRRPSINVIHVVESDMVLQAELIDIFFKRCLPLPIMLHSPTFFYRLYLGQVSPVLLDAIYAVSARLCENPSLTMSYPPNHPAYLRGEPFARRAHSAAERMIDVRRLWSEEERRMDRGTWQETELAQAAYILSVYFTCLRQPRLGLFYLESGIDILRPTTSAYLPSPAMHLGLNPIEYATLGETRSRTFWLLILHELCAVANGKPRRVFESDLGNIPLPGNELLWARCGGSAMGGREPGRRDELIAGSGNWLGEEGQIGELGHVLRVLHIFADIMALATDSKPNESRQSIGGRLELALKGWAMSLPRHLQFDEHNLAAAVSKIASPVAEIKSTGWLYAYMHAVAECGMFYLQAAVAQHTDGAFTAQRQSQAVENLTVIMDAIGARGREGAAYLFPLVVITNWQDHLRLSNLIVPGPQQAHIDDLLALWWAETKHEWGAEKHDLLQRGFYSLGQGNPLAPAPAPALTQTPRFSKYHLDGSSSSLGLYQTSPTKLASDSALSPTSTMSLATLATPNFSTRYRFSAPQLPPLRPRAATSATSYSARSPSPPGIGRQHHLPSMSAISDRSESITLPPLSADLKYRDHDRDRERETMGTSPRHHPYLPLPKRDGDRGKSGERDKVGMSPRMSWAAGDRPSDRGPLLGIAALVSAAEKERQRAGMEV